ncbi:hypothetical protein AVEN_179744-1 [Araneus ventricosus]|uniref:Uncharacterized protein n=1 Tax=Araneus ventricosus TaxID=182803 RepID=A0A4Y2G8V7_ARAVE|nr:hypothetical protein AVEN_179744-1 [Araneus ventricosus]
MAGFTDVEKESNKKVTEVEMYLICVQSPELQLLFEERSAHVGRVVELPGSIVIEDLREHARVPVEEVLVEDWIVVGEGFGQPGQSRSRNLLEGGLVSLETDPTDVQNHAIVTIDDCPTRLVHGPLREYPQPSCGGFQLIHRIIWSGASSLGAWWFFRTVVL